MIIMMEGEKILILWLVIILILTSFISIGQASILQLNSNKNDPLRNILNRQPIQTGSEKLDEEDNGDGSYPANELKEAEVEAIFRSGFDDNIFYVGGIGPENYSTIQDGINASSDGDTVFVFDNSSPYYENIIINKSISLIGEDKDTTIINGSKNGNVVTITANQVTISGFTIQNSEQGSYPNNYAGISTTSDNNVISKNKIANNVYYGIYLSSASYNFIAGNSIEQNKIGLYLVDSSSNNIIAGNELSENTRFGISLASSYNIIYGNNIQNNIRGIKLGYTQRNHFYHNNIKNNPYGSVETLGKDIWGDGYPSGGNYWSDHSDHDEYSGPNQSIPKPDGDGIVDKPDGGLNPYNISHMTNGDQDKYPLTAQYSLDHIVYFKWMPIYPKEGSLINFTDQSVVLSTGDIIDWIWDMGDGSILQGDVVTHLYAEMGAYDVTLSVTDNLGKTTEFTRTVIVRSVETQQPDLIVLVSPQYKEDVDILNAIDIYKTNINQMLGWNSVTHLMRDPGNNPYDLIEIAKNYYFSSGKNLKGVLLTGEDINLPLGVEISTKECPRLLELSTLNMEPSDELKILPTTLFPNADDLYSVKKNQLIFAFNKFSNYNNYGNDIRGYNYPFPESDSENYMENILAPLGNTVWRTNPSNDDLKQLFTGVYKMVLINGHGNPLSISLNDQTGGVSFNTFQDLPNVITPVLLLSACHTQSWGSGTVNRELDPPNRYAGKEFWGHSILTHEYLKLVMGGTGGMGETSIIRSDIIQELALGKTFAEALIGKPTYKGNAVFYGDPAFHYPVDAFLPAIITSARSYLEHGIGNWLYLDIDRDANNIEPRRDGVKKLEFKLSGSAFNVCVEVTCEIGNYDGTTNVIFESNDTINITFDPPLPDQNRCRITLSGDVENSWIVRTCKGDLCRDGATTTIDFYYFMLRFGMAPVNNNPLGPSECEPQWDFNCDGSVNPADSAQILLELGNSCPPEP